MYSYFTSLQNFFEKTLARVNATIQAETDAFMGCQVQIVVSYSYLRDLFIFLCQSTTVNQYRFVITFISPMLGYNGMRKNSFNSKSDTRKILLLAWSSTQMALFTCERNSRRTG